jgi:malate/lactate dehydrogenase
MSGAERTRKWRERKERGVIATVNIEITEGHIRAFMALGVLHSLNENGVTHINRGNLQYAAQRTIDEWAKVD